MAKSLMSAGELRRLWRIPGDQEDDFSEGVGGKSFKCSLGLRTRNERVWRSRYRFFSTDHMKHLYPVYKQRVLDDAPSSEGPKKACAEVSACSSGSIPHKELFRVNAEASQSAAAAGRLEDPFSSTQLHYSLDNTMRRLQGIVHPGKTATAEVSRPKVLHPSSIPTEWPGKYWRFSERENCDPNGRFNDLYLTQRVKLRHEEQQSPIVPQQPPNSTKRGISQSMWVRPDCGDLPTRRREGLRVTLDGKSALSTTSREQHAALGIVSNSLKGAGTASSDSKEQQAPRRPSAPPPLQLGSKAGDYSSQWLAPTARGSTEGQECRHACMVELLLSARDPNQTFRRTQRVVR